MLCNFKHSKLNHINRIFSHFQHATVLEVLKDKLVNAERALDVGSGSGYLTVCMSLMMGPNGRVVGIDHIPELVDKSVENVEKDKPQLLASKRVKFVGTSFFNEEVSAVSVFCIIFIITFLLQLVMADKDTLQKRLTMLFTLVLQHRRYQKKLVFRYSKSLL